MRATSMPASLLHQLLRRLHVDMGPYHSGQLTAGTCGNSGNRPSRVLYRPVRLDRGDPDFDTAYWNSHTLKAARFLQGLTIHVIITAYKSHGDFSLVGLFTGQETRWT